MKINKPKLLGLAGMFSVLFFALTSNSLLAGPLIKMDSGILQWVSGMRTPMMTEAFLFFTAMGSLRTIIGLAVVALTILLLFSKRPAALFLIFSVASGELSVRLLKILIQRVRPDASFSLTASDGYAFPSGHATAAMVFYGALLLVAWPWCQKPWQKKVAIFVFGMPIFLVGLSRIYLGVHWTTDVLGGWLLGGIILLLLMIFFWLQKNILRN